jgi:hypothetical protein
VEFEGIPFDEETHDQFLLWIGSAPFDVVRKMMITLRMRLLSNLENEASTIDQMRNAQGGLIVLSQLEGMIDGFRRVDVEALLREELKQEENEHAHEDIDVSL